MALKSPALPGLGLEGHGDPIDAVAETCHLGAVVENMAKMTAATLTVNLRSNHTERDIFRCTDRFVAQRRPETWPAGVALELGFRRKHTKTAAGACEDAGAMLVEERTGERPFGRAVA